MLVANCINTFKSDPRYKDDVRFLKIWLLYVMFIPFCFLVFNSVCLASPYLEIFWFFFFNKISLFSSIDTLIGDLGDFKLFLVDSTLSCLYVMLMYSHDFVEFALFVTLWIMFAIRLD